MDRVSRHVTFPSHGETLAGVLFMPSDPPAGRLPAVAVAGGQTCVKEQMAEVYAQRLADRGFAALAFDFRGFGESTGLPRDYESPPMTDYFLNPDRGGAARWANRFAVMSWPEWLAFDPIGAALRITTPTLMIHSEDATLPEGARRFFAGLAGPRTELWTSGVQFDFYDRDSHVAPAIDAIVDHLGAVRSR